MTVIRRRGLICYTEIISTLKQKILIWDLENSFNQVLTFDLFKPIIPHEHIVDERHFHTIAYRWYGEKKIHLISQLDDKKLFKKNIHSDYYVLKKFREVIEQADIHVAHNGDKFDLKMFNGRLLLNGLKPLPKIRSYDTYKIAKKHFRLNSNKLDYIAKVLGHKGKIVNEKGLWIKCFFGSVPHLKKMGRYNKRDVDILTFVFEKLMPFIEYQLNFDLKCPNPTCGSYNIWHQGRRTIATGEKYRRYQCQDCGCWGKEKRV